MKIEWRRSFIGHHPQWLIADNMALSSDFEDAYVFPVVAGAIPSVNSLGLAGGNR